jgi:hypothetical protein
MAGHVWAQSAPMGPEAAKAYAVALCAKFLGTKGFLRYFCRIVGKMPNPVNALWSAQNIWTGSVVLIMLIAPNSFLLARINA